MNLWAIGALTFGLALIGFALLMLAAELLGV